MIHAYHVVFGAYGFWLPNDPRGSCSDFVGNWELTQFGTATRSIERTKLSKAQEQARHEAKKLLKYPEVILTGQQALAVGTGFSEAVRKSGFSIWACSILPSHIHLVIARHSFKAEQIVNLLKGEATKSLSKNGLHPLAEYRTSKGRPPRPWADRKWIAYLDTEDSVENAIRYVEENPEKEGMPKQKWSFVVPFYGLDTGCVTYL